MGKPLGTEPFERAKDGTKQDDQTIKTAAVVKPDFTMDELRPNSWTVGYFTPVHERNTKWDNIEEHIPRPCCTDQLERGTRPTRDGFQAVRSKLGRPSSVIRLSMRTPILASVF
jgi:hypothetical protein